MLNSILEKCLDEGIELSVTRDEFGVTHYDLNSGTKDGPHIAFVQDDGTLFLSNRYSEVIRVKSFDELLLLIAGSQHTSNLNFRWYEAFKKHDIEVKR